MNYAAAELYGTRCRIVAVASEAAAQGVVAHHDCALADESAPGLREFRRACNLSRSLRIVLWPSPADAGVIEIKAKSGVPVSSPSTLTIRERVGPLVRVGFRVTGVCLPHQVLAELAHQQGARLAVTAAFHDDGACVSLCQQGRATERPVYLRWDAAWCLATAGSGDAAARYQFAAGFAPHVRHLLEALPEGDLRILACGSMANLRTAMAPFSEEFGREVQVLDHPWPGLLDHEAGTIPTEPAVWQLARAAARSVAQGLHE